MSVSLQKLGFDRIDDCTNGTECLQCDKTATSVWCRARKRPMMTDQTFFFCDDCSLKGLWLYHYIGELEDDQDVCLNCNGRAECLFIRVTSHFDRTPKMPYCNDCKGLFFIVEQDKNAISTYASFLPFHSRDVDGMCDKYSNDDSSTESDSDYEQNNKKEGGRMEEAYGKIIPTTNNRNVHHQNFKAEQEMPPPRSVTTGSKPKDGGSHDNNVVQKEDELKHGNSLAKDSESDVELEEKSSSSKQSSNSKQSSSSKSGFNEKKGKKARAKLLKKTDFKNLKNRIFKPKTPKKGKNYETVSLIHKEEDPPKNKMSWKSDDAEYAMCEACDEILGFSRGYTRQISLHYNKCPMRKKHAGVTQKLQTLKAKVTFKEGTKCADADCRYGGNIKSKSSAERCKTCGKWMHRICGNDSVCKNCQEDDDSSDELSDENNKEQVRSGNVEIESMKALLQQQLEQQRRAFESKMKELDEEKKKLALATAAAEKKLSRRWKRRR